MLPPSFNNSTRDVTRMRTQCRIVASQSVKLFAQGTRIAYDYSKLYPQARWLNGAIV